MIMNKNETMQSNRPKEKKKKRHRVKFLKNDIEKKNEAIEQPKLQRKEREQNKNKKPKKQHRHQKN